MKEIWKDIKNFENFYKISNYGKIKSVDRTIKTKNGKVQRWKGKNINGNDNGNGYLVVHLRKNGKRYVKYIHRLVIETFIGEIGNNDINHKDFNRKNNKLDNLEILSRKENINYSQNAGKYETLYKNRTTKTKDKYNLIINKIKEDIEKRCSYL